MALYPRLIGGNLPENEPKIPVHQFMALLSEVEKGKITAAEAAALVGLDAGEQAEALTLIGRILTPPASIAIGGQATLTNIGTTYDNTAPSLGLGTVLVELAGITKIVFGVRVNKVGSGTQSWQLWNDTDGVEVAVIDDAGATGVKNLSTTKDFVTPLAQGIKVIRIRAKSTTAQDDPVFMGAAFLVYRIARMTPVDLHEVLCLAEYGWQYGTEAALKTRLGV